MVDHARRIHIPDAPVLSRTSIPSSAHPHIDLSLKELKGLSRRLAAVAFPFTHELQILERLYYKGKNQHRSSLFWQKVVEVRRFGSRVKELDLHSILEELRHSFHAAEGRNNSKSLRSPWTQAPGLDTCERILKMFQSACCLIDKARVRFRIAYQAFTVQLRTATFLPLTISLVAITSRLDFLLSELRSTIPEQWEAVIGVATAIDPTFTLRYARGVQLPALPFALRPPGGEASRETPRKRVKIPNKILEDLGSKIIREVGPPIAIPMPQRSFIAASVSGYTTVVQPPSEIMPASVGNSPGLPLSVPDTPMASNYPLSGVSGAIIARSEPVNSPNSNHDLPLIASKREGIEDSKAKKRVKMKKKKKWDEIDNIFGF